MAEQRQGRMVRNKDIAIIQETRFLKNNIESLEKRIKWERERMNFISQKISIVPGGGSPKGLDDAFAAIAEMEDRHKLLVKSYKRQIQKAEHIIASIPSKQMQTMVQLLYMDDLPDTEVRKKMNLSRWVFSAARKTIEDAEHMDDVVWHDRYCVHE